MKLYEEKNWYLLKNLNFLKKQTKSLRGILVWSRFRRTRDTKKEQAKLRNRLQDGLVFRLLQDGTAQ